MSSARILIVDDEPNIRLVLEHTLRHEGYLLDSVNNGAEALEKIAKAGPAYDLLLLDLQMEPISGLQVLKTAREQDPHVSIIILTAHGTMDSAVNALRLNAFDYLFKPASPAIIRQRVRAGLAERRRVLAQQRLIKQLDTLRQTLDEANLEPELVVEIDGKDERFVQSGQLTIDRHRRQATLSTTPLSLTATEFDLLTCLIDAAPTPLSPRELVQQALGYDCSKQEAGEIVKWHIHQLRRKIEPNPTQPQFIKTIRHRGYLWSGG
jgi:DNA-binding response OmpR family regulator